MITELKQLSKLISNKYSFNLLQMKCSDVDKINKLEKDFQNDLLKFYISKKESKILFNKLKNIHL